MPQDPTGTLLPWESYLLFSPRSFSGKPFSSHSSFFFPEFLARFWLSVSQMCWSSCAFSPSQSSLTWEQRGLFLSCLICGLLMLFFSVGRNNLCQVLKLNSLDYTWQLFQQQESRDETARTQKGELRSNECSGLLGRKEMSQQLWEGKNTEFLCLLQALGSPWHLLWTVQGAPALCTAFHSSSSARSLAAEVEQGSLCDIPGWHRAPRCLAPHLEAVGGLWQCKALCTKVQSSRAQQLPAAFQQLLSSPSQQMETGIILGATANEGAGKTEDTTFRKMRKGGRSYQALPDLPCHIGTTLQLKQGNTTS